MLSTENLAVFNLLVASPHSAQLVCISMQDLTHVTYHSLKYLTS